MARRGAGGGFSGGQIILGAGQSSVRSGVDGCCPAAAGSAGPDPCVFDRGADTGLSVFDGAAGGGGLGKGAGFGGVGYEPVGVVALVGVAVQGAGGEVFAGVFEVV